MLEGGKPAMAGHCISCIHNALRAHARVLAGFVAAATAFLAGAAPTHAQSAGDGFLFKEPVVRISLSGGLANPHAGSDVFSFLTNDFTLSRGDFRSSAFGGDISVRVHPRVDFMFGTQWSGSSKRSEYRHFTDTDDLPIEQTTSFQRVPVSASVKLYVTPRGRAIGHYAWIPARVIPYVGIGGGAEWYNLKVEGDFVDFDTNEISTDLIESSGWAPTAHGFAGVDLSLSPHFGLTGEGRYSWAKANLSQDFSGFNRIDLSGLTATVGVYARF
jgi:hypothetical protein